MSDGTIYTNVEVLFTGKPDCALCHGKGYINYSDRAGSVEQCPDCCEHDRGLYNDGVEERCRACGKQTSSRS